MSWFSFRFSTGCRAGKWALGAWVGLLSGPAAWAQQAPDSVRIGSLAEALAVAVQHNPTQAVYQQQARQAHHNYQAAKAALLPQAAASFTGLDNLQLGVTPVPGELVGQPGTTYYAQFGKQYAYSAGITVSQKLLDWPAVLQTKVARGYVELSQAQQAAYTQTLKEQVAQLYYSTLIARQALHLNQLDRHLADTLLLLARQRLREGTINRLAANQAAINASNVAQNQARRQQLLDQSLASLSLLLGAAPGSGLRLTETLPPGAVPPAAGAALAPDQTLTPYESQLRLAATQSRQQRAAAYPLVSVSGYLGQQQFRDDFGLAFGSEAWRPNQYLGLNVSVPLFTGFGLRHKNKSAAAQVSIARLQLDQARDQSASRDLLLRKNQAAYHDLVRSSATSFGLYGDNLRLSQQQYREGLLPLDGYLRAFEDYLAAENLYLNNLAQFLSNEASLLARQPAE